MSPRAPAGSAKTKKGKADAVCVGATYMGPALSETISHAAPTLCMNVPMSDTMSAISRLRKAGARNGRQRLGISGDVGTSYLSMRWYPESFTRQSSLDRVVQATCLPAFCPRNSSSSKFTSLGCVQVIQSGPSFTTLSLAPDEH